MTLLLAACGSSGSGSTGGNSLSPAVDADSATSTPAQTSTATSSSASATSSTTSAAPTSAATPSTSKRAQTKPPAKPSIHPSAGDKPVPLCSVGQLRITVGMGNSDMQGSHRPLRFTNVSNTVCKLTGAPGVSYRSASRGGHQIGPPAKRIIGHQPIVLIPNATASAGLFISSAPQKSGCAAASAAGIRVYPPDSYGWAFVALPEVTCTSGGPYLTVGPILPDSENTGD